MEKVAFIVGETFIYWSSIILVFAATAAVFLFLALYIGKSRNILGAAMALPMAFVLSMVLARLVHWYCRTDAYESLYQAMTDYFSGGYALMGVFFGCILVACILRLLRIVKDLPEMLDCMALAGGVGIVVGRFASFFNSSDRGIILEGITELPMVFPVNNAVTGEVEYRMATFMLQAITTAIIVTIVTVVWLLGQRKNHKIKNGDAALLFLMAYGASQIVFDSTRYDSLYMRTNGFISIVQILGAVGLVLGIVVFSVRMVRNLRFKWWFIPIWVGMLALIGVAGYMEYYVQRHGHLFVFAYNTMSGCLLASVALAVVVYRLGVSRKRRTVKTAARAR